MTTLRSYRKDLDYSYTIGVFPTLELLTHRPEQVIRVLVSSRGEANAGVAKVRAICAERRIALVQADRQVERLAGNAKSYVVGVFTKYEAPLDPAANHVLLVNPSDAGNLGTIIRTMLGFDVTNLAIVTPAVDLFAPRTLRAAMGATFQLAFAHFDDIGAYRALFGRHHLYPLMTDGAIDLPHVTFRSPYTLIFGPEGAGLGAAYQALGTTVRIPQSGRIDSLNLAVSVGIALYAATRSPNVW
ncbi:MAG TPA: TrmH family RNA methyltransferase [Chloroflexi bacterium]|jgi:TrmH family RNA methyltransferase|nr:TrmH family RNA methyltransferase [Chloroflexota bacterium]